MCVCVCAIISDRILAPALGSIFQLGNDRNECLVRLPKPQFGKRSLAQTPYHQVDPRSAPDLTCQTLGPTVQGEVRAPATRGSACSPSQVSAQGRGRGRGRGRGDGRKAAGPGVWVHEGRAGRVPGHGRQVCRSAAGPAASGLYPRQLVSALA